MSLSSFLFGSKPSVQQLSNYNPQQNMALDQLLSQGLSNANPQAIEDRARTQFRSQTIPSLAERFTGMGGGQRSSAFQGALGSAGAGLEEGLAALRSQYGMQQLGMGLQPRFENLYHQRQPGFLESGLTGAASMLPLMAFGRGGGNKDSKNGENPSIASLMRLLAFL